MRADVVTQPARHGASLSEDLRHFRIIAARSGWGAFGRDLLFRLAGAPDRLPLPSPFLISLVSNSIDSRRYFEGGKRHALGMFDTLRAAGARSESFAAVLDWGCGCGRLLRHVRRLTPATLYATDANPVPVRWLRRKLPFAHYGVNRLLPPLEYADSSFDLVYGLSIFTHLDASSQRAWLAEMTRVLRPGGCFYFTTHGAELNSVLNAKEQAELTASGFLARRNASEGRNSWATFQTYEFTAASLPPALELLRFEPGRPAPALAHDAYVVRKRV